MSLSWAPYTPYVPSPDSQTNRNVLNCPPDVPPLHNRQSICLGNPLSPYGGAKEWNTNDLALKDQCMRKLAGVAPLDCGTTALYWLHQCPKI